MAEASDVRFCNLCDVRRSTRNFPSSRRVFPIREGVSRLSPRVEVCDACYLAFAKGRVRLGWCDQCERGGTRGGRSPCDETYN
jgi:hypothetical protein